MWNNVRQLNIITSALHAALLAIVLSWGGLWLVKRPSFALRALLISGDINHINQTIVRESVLGNLRGNFITLDLDQVRIAFEQIPWIHHVSVRRVWPNKLRVTLKEYKPLGVWNKNQLVSVNGEVFNANQAGSELPVFTGPLESVHTIVTRYYDFRKWFYPLGAKLKEVTLSPCYAWTIKLTNGMQIELGQEHTKDTLASRAQRFVVAWPIVTQRWGSDIQYVDLRYPNGFAIRATGIGFIPSNPKSNKPIL
ncbi:cell division protein FtsQ/DivIB [Candidatus Vallotia tarda]|uniref:Cell division protein FtsQ n=1 Tax=Candidatus Vallotiella hemipterorum TaxID=1177213 RepID=A0A916JS96_9BURK|nr:cell division protein FtsQ/DivIB [Candidatus Vallotia tarda]CAG7599340.1 Cell division protein FtsQ [Candidatus Vallotia tarda]